MYAISGGRTVFGERTGVKGESRVEGKCWLEGLGR